MHATSRGRRIFRQLPLGQHGLIEQQRGKVVETLTVVHRPQRLEQIMIQVHFQHRLVVRYRLTGRFQHPAHLWAQLIFSQHQTRRRIHQSASRADAFYLLCQAVFQSCHQRVIAFCLPGSLVQVQLSACGIDQFHVLIAVQITHHPFVDGVTQQQDFNALFTEYLQVRTVQRRRGSVSKQIIDALLLSRFTLKVGIKTGNALFLMSRRKTQQGGDSFTVIRILANTFFQNLSKLTPKRLVLLFIVTQLLEHLQNTLGQSRTNFLHRPIVLQELTADIQGKVGRVDHALHKAEILRQKLLGIIHDENTLYIQFQAAIGIAMIQVKRGTGRQVKQARVFQGALNLVVTPAQGILKVMADMLVEALVFLIGNFLPWALPQCSSRVESFTTLLSVTLSGRQQINRKGNVVGILIDHLANLERIQKIPGIVT